MTLVSTAAVVSQHASRNWLLSCALVTCPHGASSARALLLLCLSWQHQVEALGSCFQGLGPTKMAMVWAWGTLPCSLWVGLLAHPVATSHSAFCGRNCG